MCSPRGSISSSPIEEEYIVRIRAAYAQMSASEKRIADYLLRTKPTVQALTIKELAAQSQTSDATVIRFSRMIGYTGFSDMKFHILQGECDLSNESPFDLYVSEQDDINIVKQKVYNFAYNSIKQSILNTPNEAYNQAIDALCHAKNICFCGSGSACGIAMSAASLFLSLGMPASSISDFSCQLRTVSIFHPGDVVVAINYDGYGTVVTDTLMIAKSVGATTIAITSDSKSLLAEYADIILLTSARNATNLLNISTSSVCSLTTIQILQVGVWRKLHPQSEENMKKQLSLSALTRYETETSEIKFKRLKQ